MKKLLILVASLFATHAFAVMCPNNFNSVNVGDSVKLVEAACGAPVKTKVYSMEPNVPQEWSYYVVVAPPNPATVKMSVVFVNKKVANITVNAMSLVSTTLCGSGQVSPTLSNPGTINVGDDMDAVKSACGKPVFVNKGPQEEGAPNKIEATELTYDGQPPNMMYFENDHFISRK